MNPLITIQEFRWFSAFLTVLLTSPRIRWTQIIDLLFGNKLKGEDRSVILEVLKYVVTAYGPRKRRVGTPAVLHPLRTALLLSRAMPDPTVTELLTSFLHDKDEDLTQNRYNAEDWSDLQNKYQNLLEKIDSKGRWYLNEQVDILAKKPHEKYYQYLGRVLKRSLDTPEILRCKLADRLDNTLDLRIDFFDETKGMRCFKTIFDVLFLNTYKGLDKKHEHHEPAEIDGSKRLNQLYKNIIFLSILRREKLDKVSDPVRALFESIATASSKEAQDIVLHIFTHHIEDPGEQRSLLMDVQRYCQDGFIDCITDMGSEYQLDGLFRHYFEYEDKDELERKLGLLYEDKRTMTLLAAEFIAIFSSFLLDDKYRIRGITPDGIIPKPSTD